jgi:hypothetical protein
MRATSTVAFFLLMFGLGLTPTALYAQCVPDSSVTSLYAPDENEGLPDGAVTVPYEAVITLNVPEDTSYLTFTADIDRLELNAISGLPNGFTYSCYPDSNCVFGGGEYGCILVSGLTNDNADAGSYDLVADFNFYLTAPAVSLPYEITDYTITLDSVAVGVLESEAQKNLRFSIEPNPISATSFLFFDLPRAGEYVLEVYSLLGNRVGVEQGFGRAGAQRYALDFLTGDPGVYFVTLKQQQYQRSMRFIVR